MKKITLAFGSSLACLFLLAACTDATAPTTTTTTKTNATQTGSTTEQVKNDQNASLTISGTEQTKPSVTSTQEDATPVLPPAPDVKTTSTTQDETEIKSNEKLFAEILLSKNETRCKELTIARFVRDCELNILINKAAAAKDGSLCNKASTPENQADCKTQYEQTLDSSGPAPGSI